MFEKDNIPDGGGIYIYTCKITYLKYVGKCTCFRERVWREILSLRAFSRDGKYKDIITRDLQDDFKKYGEENFELSYYTVDDEEVSDVLECYFIKKHNCVYNGYNGNYRNIKYIFEKHSNRTYSRDTRIILNEEETMLAHEFKKIFIYNDYSSFEYITYNQFLNEIRAIYNSGLEDIELLKIIKSLRLYIYIKSTVNDFYYEITYLEFEGLILHNKYNLNKVIKNEFLECNNILENVVIRSFEFNDKRNYIDKINSYNANYIEYINRLNDNIYFMKKEHFDNIQNCINSYFFDSYEILKKGEEIKESIENDMKCLQVSEKRLIDTPRYIENENGEIIKNPKRITKIDSIRVRD